MIVFRTAPRFRYKDDPREYRLELSAAEVELVARGLELLDTDGEPRYAPVNPMEGDMLKLLRELLLEARADLAHRR